MSVAKYFDGAENARGMGGGQYFKGEGKFRLELKRMFVNEGHKGKFFIAEFSVLDSTSGVDPIGSTRSWAVPLTGERAQYTFGDVKKLVFALTGKEPNDHRDPEDDPKLHAEAVAIVKAAVDPDFAKKNNLDPTLLIGQQVRLETNAKPTRPKPGQTQPGTFTVHTWSPAEAA